MRALGVIFSNSEAESLYEITRKRTTGSIPFGGRYRLIDFALSNMVSARISNVAVLTQRNYQSLMDHLGSGKEWDMSRKNGGLVIFPPFSSHKSDSLYSTRLEALKSIKSYIEKQHPEIVVLSDSDSVNIEGISCGEAITDFTIETGQVIDSTYKYYDTSKRENDEGTYDMIVSYRGEKILVEDVLVITR